MTIFPISFYPNLFNVFFCHRHTPLFPTGEGHIPAGRRRWSPFGRICEIITEINCITTKKPLCFMVKCDKI